jgi:hypothetical protein
VLDGELIWVGPADQPAERVGFFLAFDALAVGQQRAWHLPLQERLGLLRTLRLQEAEASELLRESSSWGTSAVSAAASPTSSGINPSPAGTAGTSQASTSSSTRASASAAAKALAKKQQAPPAGSDTITLLFKRHLDVTADALQLLAASRSSCPYPSDGLVFTPQAMPYALGMQQLLFKWQTASEAAADITGSMLLQLGAGGSVFFELGYSRDSAQARDSLAAQAAAGRKLIELLPPLLVYECFPLSAAQHPASLDTAAEVAAAGGLVPAQAEAQRRRMLSMLEELRSSCPWLPGSIRWDKSRGNDAAAVEQMQRQAASGAGRLSTEQLVEAAQCAQQQAGAEAPGGSAAAATHPARGLPFQELQACIMERVEAGAVERWVEEGSGLEVFSYTGSAAGDPAVAAMCRGLVLHPPSSTVVATPFVRFTELPGPAAPVVSSSASRAAAEVPGGACSVCGCSARVDAEGDRICFCDSCWGGCSHPAASGEHRSRSSSSSSSTAVDAPAEVQQIGSSSSSSSGSTAPPLPNSSSPAAASFKVDGSLAIAFQWQGELMVTTRRRMDSEQAGGRRLAAICCRSCISATGLPA